MDPQDSEKITEHANNNQEPLIPNLPFIRSSDSISTPRSPRRPPVPLSTFERLPTEIHIAIIEELIRAEVDFLSYEEACRLACASPVFTRIVQKRLYLEIVLDGDEQVCEWLESDATIRGEFATRTLILSGEEGQLVRVGVVEKVLLSHPSALEVLDLFHVESVKSSSLNAFTSQSPAVVIREAEADGKLLDLLVLSSDKCEVKMDDSADKPTFRLDRLNIFHATVPSSCLSDLTASSSASLRVLQIEDAKRTDEDFDWNPITSGAFPQLRTPYLAGRHIPPLHNLLSACENITNLVVDRYDVNSRIAISDSTNQLSQLSMELASLPSLSLKTLTLALAYYGQNGGDITLQEVEDLIALPSLANVEELVLHVPRGWAVSDMEALRRNKGKKGKLVIQVHPW